MDPNKPYGGLPPSQPQGTRAYRSAASYNQHLNQHQATTAAAAVVPASGNGAAPYRNPYLPSTNQQQSQQPGSLVTVAPVDGPLEGYTSSVPSSAGTQPSYAPLSGPSQVAPRLQHHHSQTGTHSHSYYTSQGQGAPSSSSYNYQQQPHGQSSGQQSQHRVRANTTNHMDVVPPAIARIANMGVDHSGIGRNTLTPVLKRDEREWVRQGQAGGPPQTTYPQLEYLQQQAERMPNTWGPRMYHSSGGGTKMALNVNTGGQSQQSHTTQQGVGQFQPPPTAIVVDSQERPVGLRDVMSSVRSAAGAGISSGGQSLDSSQVSSSISTPPLAYTSSTTSNAGHRYGASASNAYQQSPAASLAYDSYETRTSGGTPNGTNSGADLSQMYTPLQPHQYQHAYSSSTGQSNAMRSAPQGQQRQGTMGSGGSNVGIGGGGAQVSAGSFYAPGVSPALGAPAGQSGYQPPPQQQQRGLYGGQMNQPPLSAGGIASDGRRLPNEMDVWSR